MLAPGTLLDGKWRIESELGRGGTGVVYAAVHARNGLRVAVKVLHPEISSDESMRKRFLHEGYAANRVGHPGTVRVMDDGVAPEGVPYIVMERLAGKSLDAVAEDAGGVLTIEQTMGYAIQWLDIIAAAHEKGIIHRDLKPENVQVAQDGAIKVLDFGLARIRELSQQARLTITGTPMGTPAFMPPEQALAYWDEVDARSDIYSIAASLFTLMTGRLVHDGATVPELMVRVSTRPAPPVQTVAPHVPAPIARVIDRALSFHKEARYANAADMRADLRAALAQLQKGYLGRTLQSAGGPAPPPVSPLGQPLASAADGPLEPVAQVRGHMSPYAESRGPLVQTAAPVSSGAETRRKRGKLLGLVLVALVVALCVTAVGVLVVARNRPLPQNAPATIDTAAVEQTATAEPAPSAIPTEATAPSAATSIASSAASVSASVKATAPSTGKKPPHAKVCSKDPYTHQMRCD